jgi:hypothetical protein
VSAARSSWPRLSPRRPSSGPRRRPLARWLARWRGGDAGPLRAAAVDREIENHILERAEKLIAEGMPARRAYREAERRFGSVQRVRRLLERIDQSMDARVRRNEFFGSVFRDLGQGVRLLRSSPGFALAVILTIGLGVGANTAVFSITDAVLLRPLPFRETDELVRVDRYDPVRESVRRSMLPGEAMTWERETIFAAFALALAVAKLAQQYRCCGPNKTQVAGAIDPLAAAYRPGRSRCRISTCVALPVKGMT